MGISRLFLSTFLLLVISLNTLAQDRYTLSGFVTDEATGERLINATIYVSALRTGVTTNTYGFYSINLPTDSVEVTFSYIGYQLIKKTYLLASNLREDIELINNNVLDEIVISSMNNDSIRRLNVSTHRVAMETVKTAPVLGGEADLLKTLQLLPGVSAGSEGASGLYVRGGSPDQNLILLDGVPVYNVNHLFGFLSVFNPDALHDVNIIKSGIPARYGERLSSIIDISMKEGNLKEGQGVLSISPIVGKLTYEGPIVKDKAAFIISGRRSWLGDILFPEGGERYSLYDLNAKVNTKLNDRNRLYLSMYTGRDRFIREMDDSSFGFSWGNLTSVARWNTVLSPKIFANISAYYSQYDYAQTREFTQEGTLNSLRTSSGIEEWSANADFDYQLNTAHAVKFGVKAALMEFNPDIVRVRGNLEDTVFNSNESTNSFTSSIYLEDEITVGRRWVNNIGVRGSVFSVNARNYWDVQPRFSTRYIANKRLSFQVSYNYMVQYLHLLTNSSLGLPTDLWVSSTENTRPERGWQLAGGLAWLPTNQLEFTAEAYYRSMQNLIEYAEGASYLYGTSDFWEDKIVVGKGDAYGTEFLLKKPKGTLSGWLSYTLSWANRWFNDIDDGQPFPFKYDRRHDISLLGSYQLPTKNSLVKNVLSLSFVFNSGNAVSFPEGVYQGVNLPNWRFNDAFLQREYIGQRNNFRAPAYHRMDLSFSNRKKKGSHSRIWTFSVYNVYNRLNAYFLYESEGTIKQVSLFPIIPSIAYRWEF